MAVKSDRLFALANDLMVLAEKLAEHEEKKTRERAKKLSPVEEQAQWLFFRGYACLSNKYCTVARIDRADWLERMAGRLFRSVADFYMREGPQGTLTDSTGHWGHHYCAVYSEDKKTVSAPVYQELKKLWNAADGVVVYKP